MNVIFNENSPVFLVAELSANHNHNFDVAVKTIQAAKNAGADAIKLQTYTADTITLNCNKFISFKWLYDVFLKIYEMLIRVKTCHNLLNDIESILKDVFPANM